MNASVMFFTAITLSCLSFLLFALQVVALIYRKIRQQRDEAGANRGIGDSVQPQTFNAAKTLEVMGGLAHAFAKAGPLPTSAVLCITFGLIALVSSGIIKVG